MKRIAMLMVLALGCAKKGEATLVKAYEKTCVLSRQGETYDMAKVESLALCGSIARAYNFARTAQRDEQLAEFGMCWDSYSFYCVGNGP